MQRSIELLDKVLSEYDEHEIESEGGGGGVGLADCGSSTEPSNGLTPDDESPSLGKAHLFYPLFHFFPSTSILDRFVLQRTQRRKVIEMEKSLVSPPFRTFSVFPLYRMNSFGCKNEKRRKIN